MKNKYILLVLVTFTLSCTNNTNINNDKPTATATAINSENDPNSGEWWQKVTPEEQKKLHEEEELKRQAGIKTAEPIITAIEKFYEKENKYPENLELLKPDYIEELILKEDKYNLELQYELNSYTESYELAFTYTGFGICRESYDFSKKSWSGGGCIL